MSDTHVANWDDVVEDGTLPSLRANCVLKTWKADTTSSDRLMYRVGWIIEDPQEYRGLFVNDNLIVGAGPDADEESKLTFDPTQTDSRRMKTMFAALQVHLDPVIEKCLRSAEGGKCTLYVAAPTKKDLDAGYDRNKVKNYYKLGSVDVGLVDGKASAPASPKATPMTPPPVSGLPRPAPNMRAVPFVTGHAEEEVPY